ncbi:MAG TPA: 4Fe-4S dicluster domain-containing protein [Thermoanaerobaculaceae bacterium]|nr:4Fe-4S dicluster domain-containing protein [Thermoanaerobaculaceae bacterium]
MSKPAAVALPSKEAELRAAFWDQAATFPKGFKIRDCIQCGTCTGSCPVAHAMDVTPRELVALFRAGFLEEVLRSRALWMCASCYACTVRCPQGIRITDSVYALKRVASRMGIFPRTFPAHALSEAFVGNIHSFGRNWELWFGLRYYLATRPQRLVSATIQKFAVRMLRRRRLGLAPARVRGMKEVRAIIAKAQSIGGL